MMANWKTGLRAPICITWEITSSCNLACKHCLAANMVFPAGDLDFIEATELINQLAEMEVFYINIGGGEPFIRKDILAILQYVNLKGIPIQLSTNGTLIDDQLAKMLSEITDLRFQVSLDGARLETNDFIRGPGSFAGAVDAVRVLVKRGLPVSVNFVVTKDNLHELEDCYQLARQYGAKFRVTRLRPSGQARKTYDSCHLDISQYRKLYSWLLQRPDVSTGDSFFFLSVLGKPLSGMNSCGAGTMTCSVAPNGDVYPCAFLMDEEKAGSIRRKSFAEIWHRSILLNKFREKEISECEDCLQYVNCGGGCPAVSVYYSGQLFDRDPECLILP
ncbi:MAG: mycofactocin radical SAM maturase [Clostridia bacterium]|jgi:mycofactocin radical SAM maturase|nr:mycofactocin radical SAM maturase [Clostridia bacterium]